MLDMKTIVFSYFITNTLITCFIALLWYQNRKRYAGLVFWLIDFILQAIGFLLLLLRDVAPDLVSIVIAQTLIAVGALCIYIGLERFVGKPSSQIHNYLLIGGFVGLMAYFTFVQPDISIRTILVSAITLLLTGQSGWLLLRRAAPSLRSITRDVGVVFLLYALVAFVRIIELAQIPLAATSDLFEAPAWQVVFVLINQLLCIALTFTLILMVTRRLELDVQTQEQNYASVYASMQEGMALHEVIYDATHHAVDYRILEVNPAYEKIIGLTRARVVGQKASELYGVGEPPYLDVYANVAATQQSASFETYFPPMDKHFSISVFSPALGRFATIFADITERKRAEREIEHLASFPQLNANPILEIDASGTVTYQNQAAATLLAQTQQDARIFFPPDLPTILETLAQKRAEVFYCEVEVNHRVLGENIYLVPEFNVARIYTIDITARKQAEKNLSRMIERFDLATRAARAGVWDWDIQKNELLWDDRMYELYGVKREDFAGAYEAWLKGVHPDDRASSNEISEQARRGEREYDTEFRVVWPDGTVRHLKAYAQVVRDSDGKPLRMTGINYDITERKRAEERLAYQANLLTNVRDAVTASDERFILTAWNHAAEEMFGWKAEEVLGRPGAEVLRSEFIGIDRTEVFRRSKETGQIRGEAIQYHKDGTAIFVEFNSFTMQNEKGQITGYVTVTRDITDRKRAEELSRESEARFRVIFEQAAVGVAQTDSQTGAYLQINQKHCDILGYTRAEMLQKTFQDITHPDDLQADLDEMRRLREGEIRSFAMEKRYIRKDGSIVWVNLTVSPMWQPGEVPSYRIAVIEDITERKRAQAALQEYSDRLEQMVEERTSELRGAQDRLLHQERLTVLGQIAGGIGHELRSPLGAIKNAAYLLNLSLQSSDPDIQETLQILNRQVDASDRIITSLLDLARPKPPFRRATDLRDTIDAALSQAMIPENVTVCRQCDDALPVLLADPAQLEIVFHNLIRNAVQAMPNGGQLTIATRGSDDEVSIAFSDTGGGIAPEDLAKIFQPLFSTKSRGLGIGLALGKLLVDGHHGRIDVTSQVGAGTTFVVCLPRSGQAQDLPLPEGRNE